MATSTGLSKRKGQYTLDTEACDKKIRCLLLQEQEDGCNRSVGHWTSTCNVKEQKLTAAHWDFLEVI